MEMVLKKRPKNPIIIEGFPGFGLVGTITTEFLIEHLKTEQIGRINIDDMPAVVAIHESKVVDPLGIFYNKEYNMIILHAISAVKGQEWKLANALNDLAKELNAKEIISIEGVGSTTKETSQSRIFYYSRGREKDFQKLGIDPLKEGIIMGVTGAILLNVDKVPVSCVFAETTTDLPDSKAAAKVIEVLDKYLDLNVDYKPLLVQAKKFEEKLKGILTKGKEAEELSEKKKLSYVG